MQPRTPFGAGARAGASDPPPVVAPAPGAAPARPGTATPTPLEPIGPGVVPSDLRGMTQRELPSHSEPQGHRSTARGLDGQRGRASRAPGEPLRSPEDRTGEERERANRTDDDLVPAAPHVAGELPQDVADQCGVHLISSQRLRRLRPLVRGRLQLIPRPRFRSFAFNFPVNNYTLLARLSIPLSDYVLRISDASDATKSARESSRLDVLAEKLRVASDARILYFNWLRGWAQVAIAQNTLESTRARLNDARASFEVGSISKADLLSIEALVANTEDILNRTESNCSSPRASSRS